MTRTVLAIMLLWLAATAGAQARPQVSFRALAPVASSGLVVRGSVPSFSGAGTFFSAVSSQVAAETNAIVQRLASSGARGEFRLHPTVSVAEPNLIAVQFEVFRVDGGAELLTDVAATQWVPQTGGAKKLELGEVFREGINPGAVLDPVVMTSLLRRDPDRPPVGEIRHAWLVTRSGLAVYARSTPSGPMELVKIEGRWLQAGLRPGPVEALWRQSNEANEFEFTLRRALPRPLNGVRQARLVLLGMGVSGGLPMVIAEAQVELGELPATVRVSAPRGAKNLVAVCLAGANGRWTLLGRTDPARSTTIELRPLDGS